MAANKLTAKQERFIDEYMIDLNATQAAIRSGYSVKTAEVIGHELLKKTLVSRIIEERKAELSAKAHISIEYVLINTKKTLERCLQAEPVMTFDYEQKEYVQVTNKDGQGVFQFDSKGATKALELLGKYKGMFNEKLDVRHSGAIGVQIIDDVHGDPNGTSST